MKYKTLDIEVKDAIATVIMNRGDTLNAFDATLHAEMEQVWLDLADDSSLRAIILTGAGKAFSAGGDVAQMAERYGTEAGRRHALGITSKAKRLCANMLDCNIPIIGALNGDAVGLGATIGLLCDVTVMSDIARIGDPHVRMGLVAGDGGAVVWPLLIGPNRAKELLLTGRLLSSAEASAIGLVNYAVPHDALMDKAWILAREIVRNPVWAVQWTKASVNKVLKQQMNLVFDASIAWEAVTMFTDDHHEAARAFLEKRRPNYTGS